MALKERQRVKNELFGLRCPGAVHRRVRRRYDCGMGGAQSTIQVGIRRVYLAGSVAERRVEKRRNTLQHLWRN